MSIIASNSLLNVLSRHFGTNSGTQNSGFDIGKPIINGSTNGDVSEVDGFQVGTEDRKLTSKGYLGKIWEQSGEVYQDWLNVQERWIEADRFKLETRFTSFQRTQRQSSHPDYQPYAQVVMQGKVIAEISNNGMVKSNTSFPQDLQDILSQPMMGEEQGPDYAQARARQIATYFGGRVVKADTAMTQDQFNELERPDIIEKTIDYKNMKKDPLFFELLESIDNYNSLLEKRENYLNHQALNTDINV